MPEEQRRLAEHLLFNRPPADVPITHPQAALLCEGHQDWRQQSGEQRVAINQHNIAAINESFRTATRRPKAATELSLDARLANYIVEGTRDGLIDDLNRKLAEGVLPLDVINGPLMSGMNEVGRLFNNNELIVAEVLQSAEAMKAAVNHLEQFMEKSEMARRGRVVLATVKGDVHDIGKNLVEIILHNNGYEVINLGIKVPPEELIRAFKEHQPDAIGLSGLLVKSAHQMVLTAEDLREAGIHVPLLVGGAALSEKFTRAKIATAYAGAACYAKDAMTGLRLMNELTSAATREDVIRRNSPQDRPADAEAAAAPDGPVSAERSKRIRVDLPIPAAPYLDRCVLKVPNLKEVWAHVNPFMLYGRHFGFRGNFQKALADRDPKALELFDQVDRLKEEAARYMQVRAVWQYYEVERDGNSIHLFGPGAEVPLNTFHFGRQPRRDGLCLSDYILPSADGRRDHICLFVVTAGEGIRERAEQAKNAGEYFRAHGLQALAIETAEAGAEWLHRRIREEWGFPDPPEMTMQERFTSRYRGKRYSFGYGACPNLDDQARLWQLLRPEEIGVQLTEGMMMDPEASVSAMVFHHPECSYFSVENTIGE
jgi:5-methyltetrahydrofolate--homocysteine methyltransferase